MFYSLADLAVTIDAVIVYDVYDEILVSPVVDF